MYRASIAEMATVWLDWFVVQAWRGNRCVPGNIWAEHGARVSHLGSNRIGGPGCGSVLLFDSVTMHMHTLRQCRCR